MYVLGVRFKSKRFRSSTDLRVATDACRVHHLAAVDLDRSVASRRLLEKFAVSDAFDLIDYTGTMEAAGNWLQTGKASLAVVIP
ncbi:MAG: hypothetical protein ACE5H7_07310 [Acidiferrobacterales bacterium]